MRVHLDRDRCQGHGQCVMAAADLFSFDDQGFAILASDEVPPGHEDAARRAELRCPERAIACTE